MRMDPRQFSFTGRKWRWHHLPPEIAEKLSLHASPEELVCIKSTDSRAVYRFENLYIKVCGSFRLKSILFPAAREEYNSYGKLSRNNISAVKHLGWGRAGHYTALVTEAWTEDAVDVSSYWYKLLYTRQDTNEFIGLFSEFLQKTLTQPLRHGDFHLGNILYSPSEKSFALVDLHNVTCGKPLSKAEKAFMLQILVEMRAQLRPMRMVQLFKDIAGIDGKTAADMIRRKLLRDTERLQHDWTRRMNQFLSGYAKFSDFVSYNGSVLLVKRDKLRCNIFDPVTASRGGYRTVRLSFEAALEQMLFSFYLSQLQVPHIPVAALAPNGTLYYPHLPEFCQVPEDREWVNNYNEYLLCMGLHLKDYDQWRHCSGTQLLLADFSSMLSAMPNRAMFRPPNVNPGSWRVKHS